MEGGIGNYLQNQIKQAEQIQNQMENLANQSYQLEVRIKELDRTLEELGKLSDETPIFRSVGPILYKVDDRKKLIDELTEQKELSKLRMATIEKQQKNLEEKYRGIEEIIKKAYGEASKGQ